MTAFDDFCGVDLSPEEKDLVLKFHKLWYNRSVVNGQSDLFWMGWQMQKCPMDLWIYQEILYMMRPSLIVESGTSVGGSAYYLACICDILKEGIVLTIDIEQKPYRPIHNRLFYYQGDICSLGTYAVIEDMAKKLKRTMIIFDDDHSADHVEKEMEMYASLVSYGQYMIVEDTNVTGLPGNIPGAIYGVKRFLDRHKEFEVDRTWEKFLLTFNPSGYLRKK